jgi:hypothetical protein
MDDHVQEHGPTPVDYGTNRAFSNTVLVMCSTTRKGKRLPTSSKVCTKLSGTKRNVIGVVPECLGSKSITVLLESAFRSNSIPATKGHLMFDIHKCSTMINEQSASNVAILLLFFTFGMRKATRYSADVLVDRDHRTRNEVVATKDHIIFWKMVSMIDWWITRGLFSHLASSIMRQ